MIVGIKGKLLSNTPFFAIVDVGGIFYGVNIPLTTAEKLPRPGSEVLLHTLSVYREDSQSLYGFASQEDRNFFKILVEKVSGIGPKTALNMMSRMSVSTLQSAIAAGDVSMLSKCPGIGNKTAQRLIVELKDLALLGGAKAAPLVSNSTNNIDESSQNKDSARDAISALVELGYKLPDADKAVRNALGSLAENATTEEILKRVFAGK